MISKETKNVLKEISESCESVDEFKLLCSMRGISVPTKEIHFLKWFWSIAFGNSKYLNVNLHYLPNTWKRRLWKYINDVVDDVITEEKFKNLLKTDLAIQSCGIDDNMKIDEEVSRIDTSATRKKLTRNAIRKQLRKAWKIKNKLSMHPLSRMLMLAYANKHRGSLPI